VTLLGPSGWTALGAAPAVVEPPPSPPTPPPPDPLPPVTQQSPGTASYDPARIFAADSFWNAPLPDDAPLTANSALWVRNLCTQLGVDPDTPQTTNINPQLLPGAVPGQAWFNKNNGGSPVYVVGPDQPRVPVANVQTIEGWGWSTMTDLHAAFMDGIPIPSNAWVDQSDDKSLIIYQPSTDTMWEMWVALHEPGVAPDGRPYEWKAYGGGRMHDCSTRRGTYKNTPGGPDVIENYLFGHTATGLPMIGGSITPEEWNSTDPQAIRHTLHMVVANAMYGFVPPAHRHDGEMGGDWIPEGSRVRFPADIDWSKYLNPADSRHRHIWQLGYAIQRYGIMVTDKTHAGVALRFRSPVTYWSDGKPDPFDMPNWSNEYLWPLPWQRAQIVDPSISPE
jgi:hypothetical protein